MEISNGMCPFVSATTIAGLCNKYWRTHILQVNQIGLLPTSSANRLQSAKAIKWLEWKSLEDDCHIQHRDTPGGEVKIGPYYVDGFCSTTGKVYEFNGCWYHGCPDCFAKETLHPLRNIPMKQIYEETRKRQEHLGEGLGMEVEVMWEHSYDRLLRADLGLQRILCRFCGE